MHRVLIGAAGSALLLAGSAARVSAGEALPGYRFFPARASLYAPARRLAAELGAQAEVRGGSLYVGGEKVPQKSQEPLPDGTVLVELRAFPGVTVAWDREKRSAEVRLADHTATIEDRTSVTDGVSFASDRDGRLYAPLTEIGAALDLPLVWKAGAGTLAGKPISEEGLRTIFTGTTVLSIQRLQEWNATVTPQPGTIQAEIGDRKLLVRKAQQRVAVSIRRQRLRAWEGHRLIMETKVSTGKPGHETPQGLFAAGPLKAKMVISHKYNDAEMPWAVQVRGDVMIHGSPSVPPHAASHGCIRMPLTGANPAHWFYGWIHLGAPIQIATGWPTEWPVDSPDQPSGE
jgi:lipoprotein-anchoring transpeptidase ErfK/SrfK